MWIFLPDAFLSIVAYKGDNRLLVRSRFEGDIERVFPRAKVTETPDADYRFRAKITRRAVGQFLALHAESLSYDNVKGAIAPGDVDRHDAMVEVWKAMFFAQQRRADPYPDQNPYHRSRGLDIL